MNAIETQHETTRTVLMLLRRKGFRFAYAQLGGGGLGEVVAPLEPRKRQLKFASYVGDGLLLEEFDGEFWQIVESSQEEFELDETSDYSTARQLNEWLSDYLERHNITPSYGELRLDVLESLATLKNN